MGTFGLPESWLSAIQAELLQLPQVKAAALTSLGFGHVGALVVLFAQAIAQQRGETARDTWLQEANRRRQAGMIRRAALFTPIAQRRLQGGKVC